MGSEKYEHQVSRSGNFKPIALDFIELLLSTEDHGNKGLQPLKQSQNLLRDKKSPEKLGLIFEKKTA